MTTLYFAYGSNMDEEQMHERCPGATLAGMATLAGYAFIINDRGLATLIPRDDACTPGLLWVLDWDAESALDRYEGYRLGLYDKCFRQVEDDKGNTIRVLVYIDNRNIRLGSSREGYLDRIIKAAEAHNLPGNHLAMLKRWPNKSLFKSFNRLMNEIKSGKGYSAAIVRHKDFIVSQLKQSRDDLIFETLYEAVDLELDDSFDDLLEDSVRSKADELAREYELDRAGECAMQYHALTRFLHHIESLQAKEDFIDELMQSDGPKEIGGLGVIITDDSEKANTPDCRVIVTAYAPVLASLWDRLFFHTDGISPRLNSFIDVFADAAEDINEENMQELTAQILAGTYKLASLTCSDIENELNGIEVN